MIEDVVSGGGGFYKETPKKMLTIRFETYSKIVDRSECAEGKRLPLNYYKLKSYE